MEGLVDQKTSSCILCKVTTISEDEDDEQNESEEEDVNFLFRILLEIPPKPGINLVVDGNLINADHLLLLKPSLVKWCDQCSIAIQQARKLYKQIMDATEKFRLVQRNIVGTLQKCVIEDDSSNDKTENYKRIWRKLCLHNEGRFSKFEYPFTVQNWMPSESPPNLTTDKKDGQNEWSSGCHGDALPCKNEEDMMDENEEDCDQEVEVSTSSTKQQRILLIIPGNGGANDHDDDSDSLSSSGITSPRLSVSSSDDLEQSEEEEIIKGIEPSSGLTARDNEDDPLREKIKEELPESDLVQSQDNHDEKSLNYCAVCKRSYKSAKNLKFHIKRHHQSVNKFKPVRPSTFTMPDNFGCLDPQCPKYFKTSTFLLKHLKICHPQIPLPSFKKGSTFHKTYPELHSKIVKQPDSNLFHCPYSTDPQCLKSYKVKKALETHIRCQHLGEPSKYPCTWGHGCSRTFSVWDNYQSHMDRHKGFPRWKCDLCDKQFYAKNPFISHKQREHEDGRNKKPFSCENCGSSFSCRDYLYIHKTNTGCEPGKPAKKPRARNQPNKAQKYTIRGPSVCEICGKFVKNLGQHLECAHNTDKRHMCHLCPKSFKSRQNLKLHLKRHGGDDKQKCLKVKLPWSVKNKFQCNVKGCSMRFPRAELLESHMKRRHGEDGNKEPELKCQYCGKGFYLMKDLKHHEETHENEGKDPYKCKECGKGFRTMHYLKYHQRHTHKMKLEDKRKVAKR